MRAALVCGLFAGLAAAAQPAPELRFAVVAGNDRGDADELPL